MNKRPSGATLYVLKVFDNAQDCKLQLEKTTTIPAHIALPVTEVSPTSFSMPLANPKVPPSAFFDLCATFSALWSISAAGSIVATRSEYHNYVMTRELQTFGDKRSRALGMPLFCEARQAAHKLFEDYALSESSPGMNESVHGDATLSNCVTTPHGVRLIDFSPRAAPPEAEVDIAKLLFSSRGFDTDAETGAALRNVLEWFPRVQSADPRLVNYYFATHIVRVLSKEPPTTLERADFYKEIIDHVRNSL